MTNSISKNWQMLLISGILMILLAILILSNPEGVLLSYAIYIGIGLVLAGIVRIIRGFQAKGVLESWGWITIGGVATLILGIIIMGHPGLTASILPFLFGFWAAFHGFYLVIDAFSGTGSTGMKLLGGLLTIILGFGIMFNPLFLGMTLTVWVGVLFLIVGITSVIAAFSLKKM